MKKHSPNIGLSPLGVVYHHYTYQAAHHNSPLHFQTVNEC
jgi:hypothetical protein